MSKVLVTGGCGFIGLGVVREMVRSGHEVLVADYLHPQVHPSAEAIARLASGAIHQAVDVTHAPSMDSLLRSHRPDIVVHLAAETGTGQSLSEASRHGMVNVVGTTNLLDACSRADHVPSRFVLTSSRAVYGEGAWVDESDGAVFYPGQRLPGDLAAGRWNPRSPSDGPCHALPHSAGITEPRPTNVYAATKLTQEHLLTAWCTAREATCNVLRLQNVYGPGQSPSNSYTGVLTYFAVQAAAGRTIEVFEDGDIGRDFVFIEDVVAEVVRAASGNSDDALIDVGAGHRATIAHAAAVIAAAAGSPEPKVSGAYRLGDVRSAWAASDYGRSRTPIETGLALLVESLRNPAD